MPRRRKLVTRERGPRSFVGATAGEAISFAVGETPIIDSIRTSAGDRRTSATLFLPNGVTLACLVK
jgi:hypothetical protein